MTTCDSIPLRAILAALVTIIPATAVPETALAGDDPFVEMARQTMEGASARGIWRNALLPEATGAEPSPRSADAIMAEHIAHYSRKVLDRGGWSNPHAPARGYDSGNPLLAVEPGTGSVAGGEARAASPVPGAGGHGRL